MRVRAVLTAVLLLAACTTAPPEHVTLTWWDHLDHSPVADQAVEALLARYRAAHPTVEVKRTTVPRERLERELERGPRPDIAVVDVAALPRLAAASALTDLSDRFAGWDAGFVGPARDSVRHDGRDYGVPLRTETTALLYNRDLLGSEDRERRHIRAEEREQKDEWRERAISQEIIFGRMLAHFAAESEDAYVNDYRQVSEDEKGGDQSVLASLRECGSWTARASARAGRIIANYAMLWDDGRRKTPGKHLTARGRAA
jgi:hypothetical protein